MVYATYFGHVDSAAPFADGRGERYEQWFPCFCLLKSTVVFYLTAVNIVILHVFFSVRDNAQVLGGVAVCAVSASIYPRMSLAYNRVFVYHLCGVKILVPVVHSPVLVQTVCQFTAINDGGLYCFHTFLAGSDGVALIAIDKTDFAAAAHKGTFTVIAAYTGSVVAVLNGGVVARPTGNGSVFKISANDTGVVAILNDKGGM